MFLEPPIQITNLQNTRRVTGITPTYGNMVCVIHLDSTFLMVYTGGGALRRIISPLEIGWLCGVVAVDGKQGKLAVVDLTHKVHFVTLSADLQVQQPTTKDVPLEAANIS